MFFSLATTQRKEPKEKSPLQEINYYTQDALGFEAGYPLGEDSIIS
jgi:hypothetical protein